MAASVPVYLTGSATSQVGAVAPTYAPQSTSLTFSLPERGLTVSLSVGVPRVSVKVPDSEPPLPTSTVPTRAGSPGRMSVAEVKIAWPSLLFEIDSVPVANVVFGLAEDAVKSAPDAAVIPTATSTVASAASVRLGRSTRACRRDMRGMTLLVRGMDGRRRGRSAYPRRLAGCPGVWLLCRPTEHWGAHPMDGCWV